MKSVLEQTKDNIMPGSFSVSIPVKAFDIIYNDFRNLQKQNESLIEALKMIESDKEYYEQKPHKAWKIFIVIEEALAKVEALK